MANGAQDIDLQLERDAVNVTYTPPGGNMACVIFNIALNRETRWARNPGKLSDSFVPHVPYVSFILQVQRGAVKLVSSLTRNTINGRRKITTVSSPQSCPFLSRAKNLS
jgi:hypothetical protein